ncbi:conserved hypothetical protein [Gloeothece citriformis PCC 7424]|uniref:Uncharacterized protein n=1 Tax=Gloeothece citriformis (strain PCC 7424) TaxID=65393 RepID=B7KL98_GLOC7|nr:hypothetical protein [Gloeothece citriformis]ACK72470.1 conserved hypothetical protein [Gloeothece citriformis PCC 7424]
MRRRRHRNLNLPTQNLDSFLDILTNTVGVLMFISLFITLVTVEAGQVIETPLVSQSNKKPHFFEIRNNRVVEINDAEVDRQLAFLMQSLPSCSRPTLPEMTDAGAYELYTEQLQLYEQCRLNAVAQIKNFQVRTKSYNVTLYDLNGLLYEPLHDEVGETIDQLSESDSQFETVLKNLNPQETYLAFIVRPDSFSAFRAARQKAREKGFDVGWEPHNTENPIVFGSNGRAIGVQ